MALNGINLPLAFTGQEALWQEVKTTAPVMMQVVLFKAETAQIWYPLFF